MEKVLQTVKLGKKTSATIPVDICHLLPRWQEIKGMPSHFVLTRKDTYTETMSMLQRAHGEKAICKKCCLQELLSAVKCYLRSLTKSDLESCDDSWVRRITKCVELHADYVEK